MKCGDDLNLAVLMTPFEDVLHGIWTPDKEYPPIAGGATPKWYGAGLKYIANGAVDLDTDTIKLMLVTSTHTPVQGTHDFADDFSTNEASGGSGYPAGGFSLGTLSVTQSTLVMNWDAADISQAITGGPLAFQYGMFYKYRGATMSANEVIGYVDFGAQSITGATLNITLTNPLTITAS